MITHKPILFATDLSIRGDRPLDRALMLALESKVKLYILHILDPKHEKDLGIKSREIEAQIRGELPTSKVEVEILIAAGPVADTIAEIAAQRGCGLIVTGVARYDSVSDLLLGSPVDQLVQFARQPVLIVKQRPMRSYRNITVATDFSDCSLFALNTAARLFPETILHLVHANQRSYGSWLKSESIKVETLSEEQALMHRFLTKCEIDSEMFGRLNASVEKGDLKTVLQKKIDQTGSDVIVLGTHGRSGFSPATVGSKAKAILEWARQDVMIVREPKQIP